jgi:hypothetical protein
MKAHVSDLPQSHNSDHSGTLNPDQTFLCVGADEGNVRTWRVVEARTVDGDAYRCTGGVLRCSRELPALRIVIAAGSGGRRRRGRGRQETSKNGAGDGRR